jgi:hypothetical protein
LGIETPLQTPITLHFENLQGEVLKALPEWESAWIVLEGLQRSSFQSLPDYMLELDGFTLPLQWQPDRRILMALWQRQGPGLYPLRLWYQSECCFETQLEVWPTGWGQAGLFALLEELHYLLPLEWGHALKPGSGFVHGQNTDTGRLRGWRQEFAKLQTCLMDQAEQAGLLSALAAWEPNQALGLPGALLKVSAHQARKPLFRKALYPARQILDQRPRWQSDTPENRFVKHLVQRVDTRLSTLLGLLPEREFGPERAQLQTWLNQLRKSTARFSDWKEIQALSAPVTPGLGLMARASQRVFLTHWQKLSRDFVFVSSEGPLKRSLENLPWLYQTWSILQVILALLQSAQLQGWLPESMQWLFPWQNSSFVRVLPRGTMVLSLKRPDSQLKIQVWVERHFGAAGPIHSISYAQRPDLVVQISHPDRQNQSDQLWIWDAKYRLGDNLKRPAKADLDRMHAYRDALRSQHGETLVEMACILYPGPTQTFDPGLMALQASPLSSEQLQMDLNRQMTGLLAGLRL